MDSRPSSRSAVRRSVVFSLLAHATLIVVLAALLQPLGSGAARPLALKASRAEPPPPLETLVASVELLPPEAGDLLSERETDPFAIAGGTADAVDGEPVWSAGLNGPGAQLDSRRGSGAGASFFGTVAQGDRFVYVVDISTSMDRGQGQSASEGSRFMRAMAELKASIDRLSERQSFYVILFNGQTRRMFDDRALLPEAIAATEQNKRRLNEWLAQIGTGPSTDPRQSLRLGLGMRPSALFLLSDGEFNGQQNPQDDELLNGNPSVFQIVDRHNRSGVPIHTIAYEDTSNCRVMEQIARSTGGKYQFVPPHASAGKAAKPVDLASARANFLLLKARALDSRGRAKQAQAVFRRIVREFDGTDAAQAASQEIDQAVASDP